jgi:hypothetical protein
MAAFVAFVPALGATPASAGSASLLGMRAAHVHEGASGGNLVDHGGKVLSASHTYAIWWGSASSWDADVQPGMATFFQGLNKSSFLNTATQYMRGSAVSSTFEGSVLDPSAPPKKVQPSTLGAEVQKLYGSSLDPQGIYFVFTSNFPSGGNFCAWHAATTVAGQGVAVAYMPNTTGIAGCDPGNLYNVSGSEGLRSLANVTSHEFMESVTDTLPAPKSYAWIDGSGAEIGDKCAWQFTGPVTLGHSTWQLQEEWSNAVSGCVQTT